LNVARNRRLQKSARLLYPIRRGFWPAVARQLIQIKLRATATCTRRVYTAGN